MCGACSRTVDVDTWSSVLAGRRARWEAARVANDLLAASGHRARVTAGPAAFVVRGPTGGVVIADTAGRLHTKVPLMDELKKVERTIMKATDGRTADEVFLVLDSTTQAGRRWPRQFSPRSGRPLGRALPREKERRHDRHDQLGHG